MSSKKSSLMLGAVTTVFFAITSYATLATDINIESIKKGVGLPEKNRPSAGKAWEEKRAALEKKSKEEAEKAREERLAKIKESIKGTGAKQEPVLEAKSTKPEKQAAQHSKLMSPPQSPPQPVSPKASTSVKPVQKQATSSNEPRQGRTMKKLIERMGTSSEPE